MAYTEILREKINKHIGAASSKNELYIPPPPSPVLLISNCFFICKACVGINATVLYIGVTS